MTTNTTIRLASIMAYFSGLLEHLSVKIVQWAFSKRSVQKAFVNQISCSSPIGRALNEHIEDYKDGSLESYINTSVVDCLSSLQTDDIGGFNDTIIDAVEERLQDLTKDDEQRLLLLKQRLSY